MRRVICLFPGGCVTGSLNASKPSAVCDWHPGILWGGLDHPWREDIMPVSDANPFFQEFEVISARSSKSAKIAVLPCSSISKLIVLHKLVCTYCECVLVRLYSWYVLSTDCLDDRKVKRGRKRRPIYL